MSRGNDLTRYSKKKLSTQMRVYGYIQLCIPVDDGAGGETLAWTNTTIAPHALALLPLSAMQIMQYKSVDVSASHLIKIRGEIEITELNRVAVGDRVFEILTTEDIQDRGIVKWVTCKERRA